MRYNSDAATKECRKKPNNSCTDAECCFCVGAVDSNNPATPKARLPATNIHALPHNHHIADHSRRMQREFSLPRLADMRAFGAGGGAASSPSSTSSLNLMASTAPSPAPATAGSGRSRRGGGAGAGAGSGLRESLLQDHVSDHEAGHHSARRFTHAIPSSVRMASVQRVQRVCFVQPHCCCCMELMCAPNHNRM